MSNPENAPSADAAGGQPPTVLLTDIMDEAQRSILRLMPWQTGPIAHALVKLGLAVIPPKCEEEQAYVMHWLLKVYAAHGEHWKRVVENTLSPAHERPVRPTRGAEHG